MAEFSFTSTSKKKNGFSSNPFPELFHLCFSIFSHPLYFSYFIFFSPYLFKLFFSLYPLFITTTLLLLALPSLTPKDYDHDSEVSNSKWGFLISFYQTCVERLRWSKTHDKDEEIGCLDEFEAYLVMLQSSIFDPLEPNSEDDSSEGLEGQDSVCKGEEREHFGPIDEPNANSDEDPIEKKPIAEVKSLGSLFQGNSDLEEDTSFQKEEKEKRLPSGNSVRGLNSQHCLWEYPVKDQNEKEKEVKPLYPQESGKVEESKEKLPLRSGSKVMGNRDIDDEMSANLWSPESNFEYRGGVILGNNQAQWSNNLGSFGSMRREKDNLGSFGSMRREKEWRRTLACKLFEERHNVNGSEGMDMLWETYETQSIKVQKRSISKKGKKGDKVDYKEEYEEEEEEEEEDMEGKLCCLQALKFSAGKMGRPNLLKITKALKGMGWLHHVSRHGRRVNN